MTIDHRQRSHLIHQQAARVKRRATAGAGNAVGVPHHHGQIIGANVERRVVRDAIGAVGVIGQSLSGGVASRIRAGRRHAVGGADHSAAIDGDC